jgi:hypothetical protein
MLVEIGVVRGEVRKISLNQHGRRSKLKINNVPHAPCAQMRWNHFGGLLYVFNLS